MRNLLASVFRRPRAHRPAARPSRQVRPDIEYLEDRAVPTTDVYVVPDVAGGALVPVHFTYESRDSAFHNSLGVFDVRNPTVIQSVFDESRPGSQRTILFAPGTTLGFVFVQNVAVQTWQRTNPTNSFGTPVGFFSVDGFNSPAGFDAVRSQDVAGPQVKRFFFEDSLGSDFDDMVVLVSPTGSRASAVPGFAGATILTQFQVTGGGTGGGEFGVFLVDNAQGRIGNLFPGDPGYIPAALGAGRVRALFGPGTGGGAVNQTILPGGQFFGYYYTPGTTAAGFLASNPFNVDGNGPLAYFSFPELNADLQPKFQFNGNSVRVNGMDVSVSFPRFETVAPVISGVGLVNDTGRAGEAATLTDKVTSDATVAGQITDANAIARFFAGFDANPANVDVTNLVAANGSFRLDDAAGDLKRINRGQDLADGAHTLKLVAVDVNGNQSAEFRFDFTFDSVVTPTPTLQLTAASDSGTVGDNITSLGTVDLTGKTEANTKVRLQLGAAFDQTVTSDASGNYTFTGVALAVGDNNFVLEVTDAAGNTEDNAGDDSFDFKITRKDLTAALAGNSDTGVQGDSTTSLGSVNITGTAAAGAAVQLLLGMTVVQTVNADSTGNFTFSGVTLADGANAFKVQVSGGTPSVDLTITKVAAAAPTVQGGTIADATIKVPPATPNAPLPGTAVLDLTNKFFDQDLGSTLVRFHVTAGGNVGTIDAALRDRDTLATVANFLDYRTDYANSVFQRLVQNFVLQGGGYNFTGTAPNAAFDEIDSNPPVVNEFQAGVTTNARGTIAMAKRGGDPNSGTNEFFFNLVNNNNPTNPNSLDNQNGGFTAFGTITSGLSFLDQLAQIPTQDRFGGPTVDSAFDNVPILGTLASGDFVETPANSGLFPLPSNATPSNFIILNSVELVYQVEKLSYDVQVISQTPTNPASVDPVVNVTEGNRAVLVANQAGTAVIQVTATDLAGHTVTSNQFTVTVTT